MPVDSVDAIDRCVLPELITHPGLAVLTVLRILVVAQLRVYWQCSHGGRCCSQRHSHCKGTVASSVLGVHTA
jgi:hypothetical protein